MRNVQEVIESFFEQFSLEEINLQNVNFCFFETYYKNKNSYDNDYGNLLHEVINHKYNEEKVLKLIDVLLEDDYDVNYQGKKMVILSFIWLYMVIHQIMKNIPIQQDL